MKRAAPTSADALKADPPPTHNKGKCCCVRCDPMQARAARVLARYRERAALKEKTRRELALSPRPAVLAKSAPRYLTPSAQTRRLAELIRAGKSAREAIEIIESTPQPTEEPKP
jgi:hypothetical protein